MDAELHLYDLVMIGQKETCGKELFESTMNGKKEYNPVDEARALKIIRYAFEYYLAGPRNRYMQTLIPRS